MVSRKDECYAFIKFLMEEGEIKDQIDKQHARTLFMDVYKPKFNITKLNFSTLCQDLQSCGLINYNKAVLHFRPGVLASLLDSNFTSHLNPVSGQHAKLLMQQPKPLTQDSKPFTQHSKPLTPQSTPNSNNISKCNICQLTFANTDGYNYHLKTDHHLLLHKYVKNPQSLVNAIPGLNIEVQKGHGGQSEIIVLCVNEGKEIILQLINCSSSNYRVTELGELSPKSSIILNKVVALPPLNSGTKVDIKIHACFSNVVYVNYPILFRFKDIHSGEISAVLKELIFHVHSSSLNDMHASTPFKKIKPTETYELTGVVPGQHMKRTQAGFHPVMALQQYHLSDNLLALFNNGLNNFDNMTKPQSFILREIRLMLDEYKFKYNEKLHEKNYYQMLRLMLCLEEYQMKLDIQNYSLENHTLVSATGMNPSCLELKVPGLSEQRPSLLRGDSVYVMEHKNSTIKYEGIVHKVELDTVILGFSHKFIDKVHINNRKYHIIFDFNRVPLRAEHQAINLLNEHRAISLLFLNNIKPRELKNHQLNWFNKDIAKNAEQEQAVRHIHSQTSLPMPYLIFGPPGTGKTVTIVEAILQVWKTLPKKYILVCAPTNNGADEVMNRLVEKVPTKDLFRYVAPSYPYDLISDKIKPYVNYKNDYFHPANTTILTYRIVVTTLVTASRLVNGGTPKGHFDYVFIDESGQATESATLIPIAGILTSSSTLGAITGQIVLAGDPKQLGPIIHSCLANSYGFDVSMLERLMNNNRIYQPNDSGRYNKLFLTKLVQSYRSHPAILEVPNKLFYENELISPEDKTITHLAVGWEQLPNSIFPVIFHSVFGKDEREENSPSFFNVQEMDVTLHYLDLLLGTKLRGVKICEKHIGIIAPYRKQVFKLKQACKRKQYGNDLFIGSVEQFQGQERYIMIISTVRSRPEYTNYDAKFHLGFLKNAKRFNVAITRAKALLIVIGNPRILLLDPNWHTFIKHCYDNRSIKGEPFTLTSAVDDLIPTINMLQICELSENDTEDGPGFERGRI